MVSSPCASSEAAVASPVDMSRAAGLFFLGRLDSGIIGSDIQPEFADRPCYVEGNCPGIANLYRHPGTVAYVQACAHCDAESRIGLRRCQRRGMCQTAGPKAASRQSCTDVHPVHDGSNVIRVFE